MRQSYGLPVLAVYAYVYVYHMPIETNIRCIVSTNMRDPIGSNIDLNSFVHHSDALGLAWRQINSCANVA